MARAGLVLVATLSLAACFTDIGTSEQACPLGSKGCPCHGNSTCNEQLECNDNGSCIDPDCVPGTEDCVCLPGGGCDTDLACVEQLCKPDASSSATDTAAGTDATPTISDTATAVSTNAETGAEASTGTGDDDALMLHLAFEDDVGAMGVAEDASGWALDAHCIAGTCPMPSNGAHGMGVTFDGVDDCLVVDASELLHFDTAFTLMAWARPATAGESHSLIAKALEEGENSYEIYWSNNQLLLNMDVRGSLTAQIPDPTIGLDDWFHVAGTWDGYALRLYVDGSWVASGVASTPAYAPLPLTIGCDTDFGMSNFFYYGQIDEVRVYARALDGAEIATWSER